jgi:aminoglycoside phosphotransferase (APT) family kinase protein
MTVGVNMTIGIGKGIELAARVTYDIVGGRPAAVEPLVGKGSVNEVFVVEGAGRKLVVRMSDRAGALEEYEKEAWCIARAAELGVPVAEVLGVGASEGGAYVVQTYVDGDEGRDSAAPKAVVWRELGRYARLIHSVAVPGFGLKLSEITHGDARSSWLRHVEYNVESLTEDDPLIKLGVLTRGQSRLVRDVFERLKRREFAFGLNHGDLSLRNTIVGEGGRVTLLDWGSAEAAAVPHHDLIQMLKMSMSDGDPDAEDIAAFLEGYGISADEYERMRPELDALLLLRAFDKLRWAIEQGGEELEPYVRHAREALARRMTRS